MANSAFYTAAGPGRLHVTVRNVRRDLWHQLRRESFESGKPLEAMLELILSERYSRPEPIVGETDAEAYQRACVEESRRLREFGKG